MRKTEALQGVRQPTKKYRTVDMGLFEAIFKKPNYLREAKTFKTLTGYSPRWVSWSGEIYESEIVRECIEARARHISKLKVEIHGNEKIKNKIKHKPNSWQTWGQFLARLSTILDVKNTAFIVQIFNTYGEFEGVFPIVPTDFELVDYKGTLYLRFKFANGNWGAQELSKVGILVKHQFRSDFFGEDNSALNQTMELINIQNQGIEEGVKSSATYRFMATLSNYVNDDDLVKERQNFTRDNLESGSGLLLFPHTYKDIKQIDSTPYVLDAKQMRIIETRVQNFFGVSTEILQNKAYGDAWGAFYEGAVEVFAIQFSEVMTGMLFTNLEQSNGSRVFASSNRLQYATTAEKLSVSTQMSDRGILNRDEVREIWNLPPLPNGEGEAYIIRGEYKNADEQINEGNENE